MDKGILQLIKNANGWVVGSRAKPCPPSSCDVDILIPFDKWPHAMEVFRAFIKDFRPNRVGGVERGHRRSRS